MDRVLSQQPGGPRFKSRHGQIVFRFVSISIGVESDFEEQLVHVVGKKYALSKRQDLIDIEDMDLMWYKCQFIILLL